MKILGIDSSGMVASVAIVQDDVVIAEYTMNHKKTHSETLLPMIDEIMKTSESKFTVTAKRCLIHIRSKVVRIWRSSSA